MTVTQGKWSVRKAQDKDNFWFGRWVATSPWRVDRYSKARDFAFHNTWQEALDHANEMANRGDMSNGDS